MLLRPYIATDAEWLLTVFRNNVPMAFAEAEIDEYARFLSQNKDPYFVAEHNGQVVGACGYYLIHEKSTVARICWILADPDLKGLSVGSALLRYILDQILTHPDVAVIECQTSQVAYQFFEKFGFVLRDTQPNHWAPGLDLYFMILDPKTGRI